MSEHNKPPRFFAYPKAQQGPQVAYSKSKDENPVFRGMPIVIGAWIITKLPFLQKALYNNAGFSSLQKLRDLDNYDERWEPTVIPLPDGESSPPTFDAKDYPILSSHLPGRYYSITEYHTLYLSGELTPLAVVESLLPFIQRNATPLSSHATAFNQVQPDAILQAARDSTARYKAGKPLSIFDGVPTGIKDEAGVDVCGYHTTSGRKLNKDLFPIASESAWPVQLWERAGGIVLGKMNMQEIGSDTTNNNSHWGTPLNPHNDQYYTGGSSGGAAYAVSAGLIPVALGADGGGSIRIPASFCGIYGLKPSHGRIENTSSTVTVLGPLAGTMSDLSAFYHLLAQPNPTEPICTLFSSPSLHKRTYPRKIGYYKSWFDQASPAVLAVCTKALSYYTDTLGYELVDIEIPYLPQAQLAHAFTMLAELSAKAKAKPVSRSENYTKDYLPANKVLLGVGSQVTGYDYLLAQRIRNLLMQHLAYLFKTYPGLMIVTPTSPIPGWPIAMAKDLKHGISDANSSIRNMTYVWFANFTGIPAVNVPVGYTDAEKGVGRVPVGMQAMGEWGSEDQLLGWGMEGEKYLNEVVEGGRVRPGKWEDIVGIARGWMAGNGDGSLGKGKGSEETV